MKKTLLFCLLTICYISINAQETYYSDVDLTADGLQLKQNLATKTINAHTNFLSYTPGVWEASKATDVNPSNSSEVLLLYGFSTTGNTARSRNKDLNGGGQGEWNREHTYPRSLGNPNLEFVGPGADAHHLRPSDVDYNGQRGNKKFADGSGNSGNVSGGWYPGDEWKGDVARMMMYMYIKYGAQCLPSTVGVGSNAATPDDMIDLFLEWNAEDPVSDFERQRNAYHENTNNTYAQGNRNPFIDNAYLATRIWGGTPAEDTWGIYTSTDNEAPTAPTNLVLSNITTSSINVSWTASTDNVAVTSYDVFVNDVLTENTTNTSVTLSNLNSNATYQIYVVAKDIAKNVSTKSNTVVGKTIIDTEAPSTPTNVNITKITGTSFLVNWTASTDNTSTTGYDIYLDGTYHNTTALTSYTITGLTASTTYSVTILAKDSAGNKSSQSTEVNATTTDGSNNVSEIFFSEYVEGSGFNKAVEIVNLTSNNVDLSPYTIKRQSGGNWETPLQLVGTISVNDVYVIINSSTTDAKLQQEKDLEVDNVTPMTFNGDDRIGLFKNDVLIDIIGDLDGTDVFSQNETLRRNTNVTGPTTNFNFQGEWTFYDSNTVSDIGNFNGTLSTENNILEGFKMHPNPTNGNTLFFNTNNDLNISIFNVLGKKVMFGKISNAKNSLDISNLSQGIYLVKVNSGKQFITKKLIKR